MKTQSTRRLVPHFNIDKTIICRDPYNGLDTIQLTIMYCVARMWWGKWLLKMMFKIGILPLCSFKIPFCFQLLPKAEVSSVTGGTYSGITGAGSGAVGLGIGEYAG